MNQPQNTQPATSNTGIKESLGKYSKLLEFSRLSKSGPSRDPNGKDKIPLQADSKGNSSQLSVTLRKETKPPSTMGEQRMVGITVSPSKLSAF